MALRKLPPAASIDWSALVDQLQALGKVALAAVIQAILDKLAQKQAALKADGLGDCCPDECMCHMVLCQQDHLIDALSDNIAMLDRCAPPDEGPCHD